MSAVASKKLKIDNMTKSVDTLIHCKYIVPIVPHNTVYNDYTIVIHDKIIIDLLPTSEATTKYTSAVSHNLSTHAVLPGLVNAHTHIGMTLLRGYSDDLCLADWLNNEIWPAEGKFVSPEFVSLSAELGLCEMIGSGTTCINEMYFYPQSIVDVVDRVGSRAAVGIPCLEFPTSYASGADDCIAKGEQLIESNQSLSHNRITYTIAPHAPYTVSDQSFNKVLQFSNRHNIQIHTHLHETPHEVLHSASGNGHAKHLSDSLCAPLNNFNAIGLLSDKLIAVHMTSLTDADIQLLSDKHVNVVHCPHSNLKLASGFCPVDKLIKSSVNVGIGTDSVASNNTLDMFSELKTASILSKAVSDDPTSLSAFTTLYCATLGSARALNLHNRIGSLEIGKQADIIAVNMNSVELMPLYNVISHLAYVVDGRHVSDVWVDGKQLLNNKQFTTIDVQSVMKQALKYQTLLSEFKSSRSITNKN